MNLAAFSPRKWRERQRERAGPDFADMGTAFGLDASFALEAMQRPEAPGSSSSAEAPATSDRPSAAAPRWWQRAAGR